MTKSKLPAQPSFNTRNFDALNKIVTEHWQRQMLEEERLRLENEKLEEETLKRERLEQEAVEQAQGKDDEMEASPRERESA